MCDPVQTIDAPAIKLVIEPTAAAAPPARRADRRARWRTPDGAERRRRDQARAATAATDS
jgi:hypothetical protein